MSEVVHSPAPTLARSIEDRRQRRTLADASASTTLEVATAGQVAIRQAAKLDAVAYVGDLAMTRVAFISDREQQLAQLSPVATTRLEGIANMTALSLAEVVSDTVRRLR